MFPLIGKRAKSPHPAASAPMFADADDKLVLPRPLRRAARFLVALATGRIHIPAHAGTAATLLFFTATGLYGMSLGGQTNTLADATTTAVGFAIEDVKISGNAQTSEIDILQLLGLDGATSLVALDINAAREKLIHLPWVLDAEVRKVYPRTIEVKLTEREAYAIWQHGAELSLIEKSGSVIAPLRDNKYTALPLFVGQDAERAVKDFEGQFASWPEMKKRVKAFVRVAGRRWDLHLDNGIIVKLPEDDVGRALQQLADFDAEHRLLERDIAAVDLRLSDRTTIQLTPGAAERRSALVEARDKAIKKAEKQL